jgi:hypothetical protein
MQYRTVVVPCNLCAISAVLAAVQLQAQVTDLLWNGSCGFGACAQCLGLLQLLQALVAELEFG